MSTKAVPEPSRLQVPPSDPAASDTSDWPSATTSPVRGRKRRRRSALSLSPARSPSPSRGHERSSASRHREQRRSRLGLLAAAVGASDSSADELAALGVPGGTSPKRQRRRSDLDTDHTFRGRQRHRSPSGEDAIAESTSEEDTSGSGKNGAYTLGAGEKRVKTRVKRSSPPSRSARPPGEHGPESPVFRRQRSLPNQYRGLISNHDTRAVSDGNCAAG